MPAKQRRSKPNGGNVPEGGRPEQMPEQPNAARRPGDVYRNDAAILQQAAGAVDTVAVGDVFAELEALAPLTTGDLKEFPRPSGELRAALQGLEYFRESFERAGAMLYAIGALRDHGVEVNPLMLAAVKPFTDALVVLRKDLEGAGAGR